MEFQYTYTRLNVSNFQACLQFYRDVLGFKVSYGAGEDYAELNTGNIQITLLRQQMLQEVMGSSDAALDGQSDRIALSFKVRDLDEAIQYLKSQGVQLINHPWAFPDWGFVSIFFRDPDGNLLEIQQLLS